MIAGKKLSFFPVRFYRQGCSQENVGREARHASEKPALLSVNKLCSDVLRDGDDDYSSTTVAVKQMASVVDQRSVFLPGR